VFVVARTCRPPAFVRLVLNAKFLHENDEQKHSADDRATCLLQGRKEPVRLESSDGQYPLLKRRGKQFRHCSTVNDE
jgi:hypothetical protein